MDESTIEVDSLDLEGRGVGRREGKVVFVAGALPGERVVARALRSKPSYETAVMSRVLRASAQRVRPRCPHFGTHAGACGGCSMQHLDARAQLAIKQRALEDTLWHIGRLRPEMMPPLAGPAWGYRQRARLAVRDVEKKGGVLVGFHERSSSFVADLRECHVLPPHVSRLLIPLRELVASLSLRRRLPQIEVAVSVDNGAPQTVLVLRVLQAPTDADRARLREFARQYDVVLWLQPGGPDTAAPIDPAENASLRLSLPEYQISLPFGPTDFTQVNHAVNQVLVRRVATLLAPAPESRVVDFFCGLGNFTLALARCAQHVVGIEGSARLVERARRAAAANGLADRASFEQRNLVELNRDDWQDLMSRHGYADGVLLDPPREGALAIARVLSQDTMRPRRLVYVSCNPATLARDCAILVHEGGWHFKAAGVVDMFPHTSHVESIALLAPTA